MRLCLALGIEDPEAWLHGAEPRKVALWEAFGEMEPFGEEAADLRNGMLIAAIDQFLAGDKSEARPDQFLLRYHGKGKKRKRRKVQSAAEQLDAFRGVMDFHSAIRRRDGQPG